jgi:hypothetical protein
MFVTRLRGASALLLLLWATGCAAPHWTKPGITDAAWVQDRDACAAAAMRVQSTAPAMPAVPPLSMSASQLDADRMSTVFTQRQWQQEIFASCLRAKGDQPARESRPYPGEGLLPRMCSLLRSRLFSRHHQDVTTAKASMHPRVRASFRPCLGSQAPRAPDGKGHAGPLCSTAMGAAGSGMVLIAPLG